MDNEERERDQVISDDSSFEPSEDKEKKRF
jgi:hypothetical protein